MTSAPNSLDCRNPANVLALAQCSLSRSEKEASDVPRNINGFGLNDAGDGAGGVWV
jgi:hypothetical protein